MVILSFIIIVEVLYAGEWGIHREKWMSVGRGGTSQIISLHSIYILMFCLVG